MIARKAFSLVLMFVASGGAAAAATARGDASLVTAQHQFDSGFYSDAITTLRNATTKNPKDAQAYYWLGRSFYELKDFTNAIVQLEQAAKLDAQNSLFHQWLGRAYGEKADRDHSFFLAQKTKHEFLEAVRLNSGNISARRDLEEFYLEAPWILGGSKEKAMEQVTAIAAQDSLEGHLARAAYWMDAKKFDLVSAECNAVLQLKPKRIDPYLEVASFYQRQNDATKMLAAIQAAAQVSSADLRLSYYRGVADVIAGSRLNEGEQYLKSYIASTPERSEWPSHAAAREWLGRLYEKTGRRVEASEQYRAALQLDPLRKDARDRLKSLEKSPH
jgi:tetratricopeptide (TPR) repeat protein